MWQSILGKNMQINELLWQLGVDAELENGSLAVHSPIDGSNLAKIHEDNADSVNKKIANSADAFKIWRDVPAPKRGSLSVFLVMNLGQ